MNLSEKMSSIVTAEECETLTGKGMRTFQVYGYVNGIAYNVVFYDNSTVCWGVNKGAGWKQWKKSKASVEFATDKLEAVRRIAPTLEKSKKRSPIPWNPRGV
jgi:hypothetical protein